MSALPAQLAMVLVAAVSVGIAVPLTSGTPFLLTSTLFLAACSIVEVLRRSRRVAWWAAHAALLPWGLIVLLPWFVVEARGRWAVGTTTVDLRLPNTFGAHLMALVGIVAGTAWSLLRRRSPPVNVEHVVVNRKRAAMFLSGCVALFLLSFFLARRPLAALWRLSGEVRYFDNPDGATAFQILDYAPAVGAAGLLVLSAVRRRVRRTPQFDELAWLTLFVFLALGTGSRYRLYFLLVGWLIIQLAPSAITTGGRARLGRLVGYAVGGCLLLLIVIVTAQILTERRARGLGITRGTLIDRAMVDVDVVGTGELMFSYGARFGMLSGRSYTELPSLILPRRIVGDKKPEYVAADAVMRQSTGHAGGYAAPLWLEPALNFGLGAVLLFAMTFSAVLVRFLDSGTWSSGGQLAAAARRLGPLWILVGYLVLSRLTAYQMGLTLGTVLLGCRLAGWCLTREPLVDGRQVGTVAAEGSRKLPALH